MFLKSSDLDWPRPPIIWEECHFVDVVSFVEFKNFFVFFGRSMYLENHISSLNDI